MKTIILAVAALFVGILLADIPPLNAFFIENGLPFLAQKIYTLPVFFLLVLFAVKGLYDIYLYTDETIPLKLGVLGLVLAVLGLLIFFRLLILGMLILIAGAYWSYGIVNSYYPKKSRS